MKLSQIQVAEVSLVDKAANKRRYLLYKRDGSAPKPGEILKAAREALEGLVELLKAKNEGGPNEGENYAQQAKDLLNDQWPKLVSYYTDEERSALAKVVSKGVPPPEAAAPKKDDELEFSPEDLAQLESLDKAVTSLQQQLDADKQ